VSRVALGSGVKFAVCFVVAAALAYGAGQIWGPGMGSAYGLGLGALAYYIWQLWREPR
jgi:hypothetical protein